MTTITCSSDCIYQCDGRCTLENITFNSLSPISECIFFEKKISKRTKEENVQDSDCLQGNLN